MTLAEEVNQCLRSKTPPLAAVVLPNDTNPPCVIAELITTTHSESSGGSSVNAIMCCQERGDVENSVAAPHGVIEKKQHSNDEQNDERRYSSKVEMEIRALLLCQRVHGLLKESHLLLDYLRIDSENIEKLEEMEQVTTQIGSLLEETDADGGGLVLSEYSGDREKLEKCLQICQAFLYGPRPSSISLSSCVSSSEKETTVERKECLVCFDNTAVMATVPCGHKILCQECVATIGDKLDTCYICKTELKEPKCIRIFD
jgi:hypothetical protein